MLITFFWNKIKQTFLLERYKYGFSDCIDFSFKIVAQLDPNIWQFYEKIGLFAIETTCPTARHNFLEKMFSYFRFGWPATTFWKVQERLEKLAKFGPVYLATNLT